MQAGYSGEVAAFVGRAEERELLGMRLADVQDRHARTVVIGGDAGVGKSRLVATFAESARAAGAQVLVGVCEEHFGDPMPYQPLLELLETFGREHGRERARELGGEAYARLTSFFDLDGDSMTRPQQVFLAVRRMLDDLGADAPVVLIIEDLHWADSSTLDLVRHLAQARQEDRRLLLICTYRRNELTRDNALWQLMAGAEFLRRTERIELLAFTLPELREFLAGVNGGRDDRRLAERCFEWSDGVAFSAEQLIASGALDEGQDVRLPTDLETVVLARLADLGPDARKVLRVAAVAGRAMSRRLLRTVSGLPADVLHEALQECFDRQMLITGQDQDVYRFRHALLREAVYQKTVRDLRVDLHTAMAEALESDPGLSLTEGSATAEQASHWYQADVRPKALASAVQAGQLAVRTLAFPSAEVQFDRALQLWQQVEDPEALAGVGKAQLLIEAAHAARWSGHVDQAVEYIQQAIAEDTAGGAERDRLGELQERLATYLVEAGRIAESVTAFQTAAQLLAEEAPSAMKARVLAGVALAQLRAGHYEEGKAGANTALTMAKEVDARAEEGRALSISGLAMSMLGDPDGEDRMRRALEIAQSVHHIEDLLRAHSNLGLALEHAGRLRDAAKMNQQGLDEARRLDLINTRQGTILANNASAALVPLGEWDEAERIITEVSLDRPVAETLYPRLTLAELKVARGEYAEAHQLLAAIATVELGEDPRFLGPLHTTRAELARGEGHLTRAIAEVKHGVDVVRGENTLELLRLCAVGLGAAADQAAERGAGTAERDAAMTVGNWLASEGADGRTGPSTDETEQLVLLCKAERQRIQRDDTAALWRQVAAGWAELDRPYPAAYARFRQAAALPAGDRSTARQVVREVHQVVVELGAAPLRGKVVGLAKKLGFDLEKPVPVERPYKLTPKEFETLRLLVGGNDAGRIAAARGVVPRTAETQLLAVYRKLNVHSAVEAIAKANDEGLLD